MDLVHTVDPLSADITVLPDLYDVLIVGAGPAALSAATVLARQLHTVVIFDDMASCLPQATYLHLLPTWEYGSPIDLRFRALHEVPNYYQTTTHVPFKVKEVRKLGDSLFEVKDAASNVWRGRKLVLANGLEYVLPHIRGYADCWATGVFHTLFWCGYEQRGKASSGILAVRPLGAPDEVMKMARNAAQLTSKVTIYTNDNVNLCTEIFALVRHSTQFAVENRPIRELIQEVQDTQVTVVFGDGERKTEAFLGHRPTFLTNLSLAGQLGLEITAAGQITARPPYHQTSQRSVFAAGDCARPFMLLTEAMTSGTIAGSSVAMQLQAEKYGHPAPF